MYMNQRYNETAIKGEGGMLRNNIFIAELKQKLSHKTTLRAEAQYLNSADGDKDWLLRRQKCRSRLIGWCRFPTFSTAVAPNSTTISRLLATITEHIAFSWAINEPVLAIIVQAECVAMCLQVRV